MSSTDLTDPIAAARDPRAFRELGHAVVDLLADHLERAGAAALPPLPPRPPEAQAADWALSGPGGDDPLELLRRYVEASHHLHHPRSVGHQVPPPLPLAALADAVAALLNNSAAIYEMGPVATMMEREVVAWMARALGLDHGAGGVLTSGGSLGILRALVAARRVMLGATGADAGARPALLVGEHAHYSAERAAAIMGLSADAVVRVPTDDAFRMRPDALPACLERAGARGLRPFALVASGGVTATGSFDPLEPIADVCARRGLWLHVDAAHGGGAALSPAHRHLLAGVERADSVVWDAHKMLMMPALVTGVLFRDADHCRDTFTQDAAYLLGSSAREEWYNLSHQTVECTKNAMALKLYLTLRTHGPELLQRHVERCFALGEQFGRLVEQSPDFELATAPPANIVCFRHLPAHLRGDPGALDAHQSGLRQTLLRAADHYLVQTRLRRRAYLRVTFMNPATGEAQLRQLLDDLRRAAAG